MCCGKLVVIGIRRGRFGILVDKPSKKVHKYSTRCPDRCVPNVVQLILRVLDQPNVHVRIWQEVSSATLGKNGERAIPGKLSAKVCNNAMSAHMSNIARLKVRK